MDEPTHPRRLDENLVIAEAIRCRHPVERRSRIIDNRPGLDAQWPPDEYRNPVSAFPVGILLAPERANPAVRPLLRCAPLSAV